MNILNTLNESGIFTIIVAVALVVWIPDIIKWMLNIPNIRSQLKDLRTHIDKQVDRLDTRIEQQGSRLDAKIEQQGSRLERLDTKIEQQGIRLEAKIEQQGSRLEAKIEQQGIRLDRLDAKIEQQGDRLEAKIEQQGGRLDRLDKRLNRLILALVRRGALLQSESPLRLTLRGEKVAKKLKAYEIIEKHSERLKKLIYETDPTDAYEVQKACFLLVNEENLKEILEDDALKTIRNFCYQEGERLEVVLKVFAVILRNIILEETGYGAVDVDNHKKEEVHEKKS